MKNEDAVWKHKRCEEILELAKKVIEENGGHDITFVGAVEHRDEEHNNG